MSAPADPAPPPAGAVPRWVLWVLCLAAPLVVVGPSLRPGYRFLPQLPVQVSPLSAEHPQALQAAAAGTNYLSQDRIMPFLTDQVEIRRQVLDGVLPAWEPNLGMGVPLLGGSLIAPLYPPNLLAILLPPDVAAGWLALICLLVGGTGMWALARTRGLPPAAAAVAVVAWQTSGWGLANMYLPMKVDAAAWLPWCLWAVEGIARGRRGAGFALAAFTACSFLAGWVPVAVFCGGIVVVWTLWRFTWGRGPDDAVRPQRALTVAAYLALGVAGAAVQVAPTIEASRLSLRQRQTTDSLAAQSVPPAMLASVVVPHVFGRPDNPPLEPHPNAVWLAGSGDGERLLMFNILEWNAYAGVAVVALAGVALVAHPAAAALPFVLLLLAYGFAQGWPGMRLLYGLPGLDLGAPNRVLAVQWFLWPWLAALGAQCLLARRRRALPALVALAGVAVLGAGGFWLGFDPERWVRDLVPESAKRFGMPLEFVQRTLPEGHRVAAAAALVHGAAVVFWAGAAVLVAAAAGAVLRSRPAAWTALPLLAVIAVEGIGFGAAWLQPRRLEGALFPDSPAITAIAEAAGDGRVMRLDESDGPIPHDVIALAQPNILQPYGVADLTPYIVFTPKTLIDLFGTLDPRTRFRSMISDIPTVELVGHPLLDVARVTVILARRKIEHPRLELAYEAPRFFVYRRTGVPPAVRVVRKAVEVEDDAAALRLLTAPDFDAAGRIVLPPGVAAGAPPAAGEVPEALDATRVTPAQIDVAVQSTGGGFLVFHEQFAPGWSAWLDGEPVEVLRVNHAQRAIRIPAGRHTVWTEYAPRGFWNGLLVSVLALGAAWSASYLGSRRRLTRA